MKILNLGAGTRQGIGILNVDRGDPWPTDGSVDIVLACHVLEHLHDIGGMMLRLRRLLRRGGLLYVRVPYKEHPLRNPLHLHEWDESSVEILIRESTSIDTGGWRRVSMERLPFREFAFTLEATTE